MTGPERPGSAAGTRTFRFAPSPNGFLHRGHAYSALLNAAAARACGGRFLLRIENLDPTRSRAEFVAAIFEDLAWLGLAWETPVMHQSARGEAYRAALAELDRRGLIYPAFLSRAEIQAAVAAREAGGIPWPRDPDGAPLYPGPEREWPEVRRRREMADGRPYALRLDMTAALAGLPGLSWREADPFAALPLSPCPADPAAWGDVVLARREVPASYHLAVVVDDAAQEVTDVVRGLDLRPATAVHRLLQSLLGLPEPRYFHHRLITDSAGEKLGKSRGSESIRARRAAGESAAALIAGLGLPRSAEHRPQRDQPQRHRDDAACR